MMHRGLFVGASARPAAVLALAAALLPGCSEGSTEPPAEVEFSVGAPEKVVDYAPQAIGIPGGYDLDISPSGTVVGKKLGAGGETGFVWSRTGGEQSLGSLGGTYTTALGINAKGEAVGSSSPAGSTFRVAFLRSSSGALQAIGPVDTYSFARDVSDAGVVVGSVNLGGATRAFRWTAAGGMAVLPGFGGGFSVANAVNEGGVAVGTSNHAETTASEPAMWSPSGEVRRLPSLGPLYGVAFDINRAGQAVGISADATGKRRAVLWETPGEVRDLGTLGGTESEAWGINDHGEVVGGSRAADGAWHAFYWSKQRGMVDLGMLSGADFSSAVAINDAGQIVGLSGGKNGGWVTLWEVTRGTE